jgi:hypothetical protein
MAVRITKHPVHTFAEVACPQLLHRTFRECYSYKVSPPMSEMSAC